MNILRECIAQVLSVLLVTAQTLQPFWLLRYVIVYKKGYQEFQEPYSSVTTKVKGVSLTNLSQQLALYGGVHVWDSADFVIPPEVGVRKKIA